MDNAKEIAHMLWYLEFNEDLVLVSEQRMGFFNKFEFAVDGTSKRMLEIWVMDKLLEEGSEGFH